MSACQKDLINSVPTFLQFLKRSTWIRNVCKTAAFCRGQRLNEYNYFNQFSRK